LAALKLYKNRLDGLNTTGYGESKMNNLITFVSKLKSLMLAAELILNKLSTPDEF